MSKNNSLYSQSETLIFQAQEIHQQNEEMDLLPQQFELELRKERFIVDKDLLYSLPESMFQFIFPYGLQQRGDVDLIDDAINNIDLADNDNNNNNTNNLEKCIHIDFDPTCFQYIINFYQQTQILALKQKNRIKDGQEEEEQITTAMIKKKLKKMKYNNNNNHSTSLLHSFMTKQVIIILREELEYYVVPINYQHQHEQEQQQSKKKPIQSLKYNAGIQLVNENNIFQPLIKNIKKENNTAEQHLVDMLCDAGFSTSSSWAYRNLEPRKTCILSISLLRVNLSNFDQKMSIAQKLLLFWKKPARKCWWDMDEISLDNIQIKLWKRRTWTLELSMI